jgi:hypothetical protein
MPQDRDLHILRDTGSEPATEEIQEATGKQIDEAAQHRPTLLDTTRDRLRTPFTIGIDCEGAKNVLGLWVGHSSGESAKFWLSVLAELQTRGVNDVCILCCDGLTGLPDAVTATWPATIVQTCVVHLIRASLRYASRKDWSGITKDLRPIYTASDDTAAAAALDTFAERWEDRYPAIVRTWHPVPCLPAAGASSDLHDEPDREHERPAPQSDSQPRALPLRASCSQGPLSRGA